MDLSTIWISAFLVLLSPASLGYPFSTRSQSLTSSSLSVISLANPVNLGNNYPVYPTTCFTPQTRGRRVTPLDLPYVLSDCSWIINDYLLQQHELLFQDLVFGYSDFRDRYGERYSSRWEHGQCVIRVTCGKKGPIQTLQLFNVVLAANKILKECIEDQRLPDGGIDPIGLSGSSFYVSVLGSHAHHTVNEHNVSLSSDLNPSRRNVPDSLPRTISDTGLLRGGFDVNQSIVSVSEVGIEKRKASDSQHEPLLSTSTESQTGRDNLSRNVNAPPRNYPVDCFNPYSIRLKPADGEDCNFVINQIILTYPNPMTPQTFGYGGSVDVDLSLPENEKWIFGRCVIFVRNTNKTRTDTFRMVDVASAAHMIVSECVVGAKYPLGGTTDVGAVAHDFYVGVGGMTDVYSTPWAPRFSPGVELVDVRVGSHGNTL